MLAWGAGFPAFSLCDRIPEPCGAKNMKRSFPVGALLASLVVASPPAAAQSTPDELLQSALYKQQIEGDLRGAADILQNLVGDHGQRRDIAARALVHLGMVRETLGLGATDVYRRVVAEYPEQQAAVAEARARLAARRAGAVGRGGHQVGACLEL